MTLHPSIAKIAMPDRVARLPVDPRGYPVPWFVQWLDAQDQPTPAGQGRPEFRIMDHDKLIRAVRERRCWICGDVLGRWLAFVIGPMCAVNRISSEPPSHVDCAEYAAQACPFLAMPKMRRREAGLPDEAVAYRDEQTTALPEGLQVPGITGGTTGGFAITRNPGVALVWVTRSYRRISDGRGGILFEVGEPLRTTWWCEGRPATRDEVLHSIETGLPFLRTAVLAEAERDRADAHAVLTRQLESALLLVPA